MPASRRKRLYGFTLFAFLSALLMGASLLTFYPLNQDPSPADAIIVLGCAANQDGTPSPILRSRVEKGVELWRKGYANRLILTGAAVANASVEADVMEQLTISLGVPFDKIFKETKARSTVENARLTTEILNSLGLKTALVVTSPFHTRRARYIFKDYLYEFKYVAAPYPPTIDLSRQLFLTIKDCLKLVYQIANK